MPNTKSLLLLILLSSLTATRVSLAAGSDGKKTGPAKEQISAEQKATEQKAKADADKHDNLEFTMIVGLGSKAWEKEDFPEATKKYKEGLEFAQKHFPADDVRVAQVLLYLARAQNFGNKEYAEASKSYELCRDTLNKNKSDTNFIKGDVLFELACVYAKQSKTAESDAMLLEANEIYSKIYGSDDNHHASVLRRQANNLILEGKSEAAVPKLEEAMGIFERKKAWGKLGPTYRELAELYTKTGKTKEADVYKQKAEKTELEHPKAGDSRIE